MSCQASIEDFYRYMDDYVDEAKRQEIRRQLDACGGCGEVYNFEATIQRMMRQKCRSEMPDGLRQRVFGTIIGSDLRPGPGPGLGTGRHL